MDFGAGPSRAAGSNPARETQSSNDQELAIRGFLREAGVDESALAGSYFYMVQLMRSIQCNNGGVKSARALGGDAGPSGYVGSKSNNFALAMLYPFQGIEFPPWRW